jgi:hypothetical protein
MGTGLSTQVIPPETISASLIIAGSGILGGFSDLYIWRKGGLWKKPELSRNLKFSLPGITVFLFTLLLLRPVIMKGDTTRTAIGVAVGLSLVSLLWFITGKKGFLFNENIKGFATVGSILTSVITIALVYAGRTGLLGFLNKEFFSGLLLSGAIILYWAINIIIKMPGVVKFYKNK